jgi:hypothetical protein
MSDQTVDHPTHKPVEVRVVVLVGWALFAHLSA